MADDNDTILADPFTGRWFWVDTSIQPLADGTFVIHDEAEPVPAGVVAGWGKFLPDDAAPDLIEVR